MCYWINIWTKVLKNSNTKKDLNEMYCYGFLRFRLYLYKMYVYG